MMEKVPMWNPYAYSYDNPVVFIDVDGNLPWSMLVKGFSSAKPSPPTMRRVHPTLGRIRPHHGIDMPATKGTPIFAAAEGTVLSAGSKSGYGNTIVIDHGNGYFTLYAHIQEGGIGVKVGQKIKDGQKIGEVGMTGGVSSGNYLHVEFIKIDDPNKIFMKGKEKSRFNPMEIQDLQNIITGREKSDVTFVDGHTEEVGSVDNLMKLSNSSVD